MEEQRVWDFTTLDMFLECRRKYYWRMVRHLAPKTVSPALEFGKCIHEGLEIFYKDILKGLDRPTALQHALEIFKTSYKDREGDDKRTVANGVKLLTCYEEVYRKEPFKIIDVEVGFAVPIGGILWGGRLDMLIEWDTVLYVLEHKTTAYLSSNYFQQYPNNSQVDSYIYGATETLGRRCMGVVIDALEVWKDVKRVTDKTKKMEDHFVRDPVMRSPFEITQFQNTVLAVTSDITKAEETLKGGGDVDKNFYCRKKACFSYNYRCPYFDLCKYGESPRLIERDYKEEKWEPYKEEQEATNGNE